MLAIALAAGIFSIYMRDKEKINSFVEDKFSIKVDEKNLVVKIADSAEERAQGLQNVQKLEGYDGMLFIFEEKEIVTFWNKNTLLDLDVVWISDGKVVGVDFLPNQTQGTVIVQPSEKVNMVLELPHGKAEDLKITPGTLVSSSSPLQLD